jgi:hypothetical protein
MVYFFWVLLHVLSVIGFQYTNVLWFLVPAVLHTIFIMVLYVISIATILDPNFNTKTLTVNRDFGPRFLFQFAIVITASQLFLIGYSFFAGMIIFQSITIGLSIIIQKILDKKQDQKDLK